VSDRVYSPSLILQTGSFHATIDVSTIVEEDSCSLGGIFGKLMPKKASTKALSLENGSRMNINALFCMLFAERACTHRAAIDAIFRLVLQHWHIESPNQGQNPVL
jgi:hypothetical protein